ncbi:MAG: hypothetical protein JWO73_447 [Candidatus Taylorbacteria bacterium]|nr:hypothetical protein [Candidatus Taylorbacteria bacterium]
MENLLSECNSSQRWRWIDLDTVQFVHILLSDGDRSRVWARVTMKTASVSIRIECSPEIIEFDQFYAVRIVSSLREADIDAMLVPFAPQPSRDEYYAPILKRGSQPFD